VSAAASLALVVICAATATTGVRAQPPTIWCTNPYALCAYANCTINDDGITADCGCYGFPSQNGTSMAIIGLIPNGKVKMQTLQYCSDEDSDCSNATSTDDAPFCESVRNGHIFDGHEAVDLVSTYSEQLSSENGVVADDGSGGTTPSWQCPAAPGRRVPICMLAPCAYTGDASNPYSAGTTNMTCTCPTVEVTVPYDVTGGLQDPCSIEPTKPGDYVQAAAGALLPVHLSDQTRVSELWDAVELAFLANHHEGGGGGGGGGSPLGSSGAIVAAASSVAARLLLLLALPLLYC